MSLDFTDDKSTLVQVMAWCRQATDHYLGQYSLRSMSPYGLSRPQWVKGISSEVSSSQMDIIDIKKICMEHTVLQYVRVY